MDDNYTVSIEQTFQDELGIKKFRFPAGTDRVLIRTHPIPEKTHGGVYLPPKLTRFYGELPHMQQIIATVLASGSKSAYKPGDKIAFMRLHFMRWHICSDGTFVGWINDTNTLGWVEDGAFGDADAAQVDQGVDGNR